MDPGTVPALQQSETLTLGPASQAPQGPWGTLPGHSGAPLGPPGPPWALLGPPGPPWALGPLFPFCGPEGPITLFRGQFAFLQSRHSMMAASREGWIQVWLHPGKDGCRYGCIQGVVFQAR